MIAPPINDNCVDAIELTDLSTCNSIHVVGTDATSESNTTGCDTEATDIWYKFTATSTRLEFIGIEFSDYSNSSINYEIYSDGCNVNTRFNDNCYSAGFACENCPYEIEGFTIGQEYYLRIWFHQGQEADFCIKEPCNLSITNHTVTTCNNGDNTYDLTVDISTTGLEIGDSLVIQVADNSTRGGPKITTSSGFL